MKKFGVHNMHHVQKCLDWRKAILVMTGRAHCFHVYICVMAILFLQDLSTLCIVNISYIICVICVTSKKRFFLGQTFKNNQTKSEMDNKICQNITFNPILPCVFLSQYN